MPSQSGRSEKKRTTKEEKLFREYRSEKSNSMSVCVLFSSSSLLLLFFSWGTLQMLSNESDYYYAPLAVITDDMSSLTRPDDSSGRVSDGPSLFFTRNLSSNQSTSAKLMVMPVILNKLCQVLSQKVHASVRSIVWSSPFPEPTTRGNWLSCPESQCTTLQIAARYSQPHSRTHGERFAP